MTTPNLLLSQAHVLGVSDVDICVRLLARACMNTKEKRKRHSFCACTYFTSVKRIFCARAFFHITSLETFFSLANENPRQIAMDWISRL